MQLLKLGRTDGISLQRFRKDQTPPYAILSHTWGQGEDDEVTYNDIISNTGKSKPGYQKLRFCGKQAAHDGLEYFWIDTCCIDKSKQVEYGEAINSMFRWYQRAERCYVHLSDVSVRTQDGSAHVEWQSSFRNSRWFRRGWTLQELLAPRIVEFYSRDGIRLGDRISLQDVISTITGINAGALGGRPLSEFSIEERLRWSEGRETTVEEDQAHCLLGIFDVHLGLIPAEGRANAMRRLLEEVHKRSQHMPSVRNNCHWLVPRRSNPLYTGQEELRSRLREQLIPSTTHDFQQDDLKAFVLYGIGGVGKSEISIKFAEEHRERFWGVFWIDATSTDSAERSFAEVAERCSLGRTGVDAVRSWLANNEHNWLLIIDNADDPEFDYNCYIPAGNRGSIILTSRSPDCACYGVTGSSEVVGLSSHDAVELLFTSCEMTEDMWPQNITVAQRVVEMLGLHPLAIVQAGAFIRRKFCSLQEYPDNFHQRRRDLLEFHPRQAQSTYRNVYATFDVSAAFLEQSGNVKHSRALKLLNLFGFMSLNGISESIFTRAAEQIDIVAMSDRDGRDFAQLYEWHLERVPQDILPKVTPGGIDAFPFREARDILASLSLVKISSEGHEISLHPLVHAWIKDRLQENPAKLRAEWEKAAVILALSTKESIPYKDYYLSLNVQIVACLDACPTEIRLTAPLDSGYGHLFYRLGYIQTFVNPQSPCVQQMLSMYIGVSRTDEGNILRCKRITGSHMRRQDSFQAAALLEDVVHVQSLTLAEDDFERLDSQHELAKALISMGNNIRAAELLEEVVRMHKSTLVENDRDRLNAQHDLAGALMQIGDNTKAVALLEEVVRIKKSTLSENDSSRLASQHVLAQALMQIGNNTRAVALLEEVTQMHKSTLAENDRDWLDAQHDLAGALMQIGDNTRAVALLEEVVRIEKSTLSENDSSRLASQHVLAQALMQIGNNTRAVALLEEVVRIKKSILSKNDSSRLASQHELARALMKVGDNPRAVVLLKEVVRIEKSTLSENDRNRLIAQHDLAGALMQIGDNTRAVALLEEVVRIDKSTLSENDSNRLASQQVLA